MKGTDLIESITVNGKRAKGKADLIKHLEGDRLTYKQAVNATCYECMGYCIDGLFDCEIPGCPLYPFMPYNLNRIKRSRRNRVEDMP